jgi:hypothetical protein
MPISSLNKVIALLIVGSIALLWIGILFWTPLSEFALKYKDLGNAGGAVVAGLLFLAGSALVGSVIEALTDLTVRPLIKKARRQRSWARFFGQAVLHDDLAFWELFFREKAERNELFQHVVATQEPALGRLAWGILHKNSSKEHADWAATHHAMYYLAANLSVLLTLVAFSAFPMVAARGLGLLAFFLVAAVFVPCIYLLWSLAIDRYLYTYLVTFRFGVLYLSEAASPQTTSRPDPSCSHDSRSG